MFLSVVFPGVEHRLGGAKRMRALLRLASRCRAGSAADVPKESDNEDKQDDWCEVLTFDACRGRWRAPR